MTQALRAELRGRGIEVIGWPSSPSSSTISVDQRRYMPRSGGPSASVAWSP